MASHSSSDPGHRSELTADIAGLFSIRLDGLDSLTPGNRHWVRSVLEPLASTDASAPEIHVRFAPEVRQVGDRLSPLPIGVAEDEVLWVADKRGHSARLPLAQLTTKPVVVDGGMEPAFFESWVLSPLLRAALWRRRATLIHAAAAMLDGRAVAITGWSGSGKSWTLYRLLQAGAGLLADDWLAVTEAGLAAPIQGHVDLTSAPPEHVHRVVPRDGLPAGRSRKAAARWAAARVPGPVSGRLAKIGHPDGIVAAIQEAFPGSHLAAPARLDTLVVLLPPGREPGAEAAPELVAAQTQLFLTEGPSIEGVFRMAFPGVLERPLFPSMREEIDQLRRALHVHVVIRSSRGSAADVDAVVSLIRSPTWTAT